MVSSPPVTVLRILVPPARPEMNPLLQLLRRGGAEGIEFPLLQPEPPRDVASLDLALARLDQYAWIIFSGGLSVENFLSRLALHSEAAALRERLRQSSIVAIGHAALQALKAASVPVSLSPRQHTAEPVVDELTARASLSAQRLLLVRVEGAGRDLPAELERRGARVEEASGYRMEVRPSDDQAANLLRGRLDAVALANPTAVRYLGRALAGVTPALRSLLTRPLIAAAGPATAQTAEEHGFRVGLVAAGHVADLARQLLAALTPTRPT